MFIHDDENAINVYSEGSERQNFGNCCQQGQIEKEKKTSGKKTAPKKTQCFQ